MLRWKRARVVALAALMIAASGTPTAAQSIDRAALVQKWFDTRNAWDKDGVLAMMTPSPVFVGGPCPLSTPCAGLDAVSSVLDEDIANHIHFTVLSAQTQGSSVVGQFALNFDPICAGGVDHIVETYVVDVPRDKVATYVAILDSTDESSARYLRILTKQEPAGQPCDSST
jgi:hypothetical protein